MREGGKTWTIPSDAAERSVCTNAAVFPKRGRRELAAELIGLRDRCSALGYPRDFRHAFDR
jgi:hypothetical protein